MLKKAQGVKLQMEEVRRVVRHPNALKLYIGGAIPTFFSLIEPCEYYLSFGAFFVITKITNIHEDTLHFPW